MKIRRSTLSLLVIVVVAIVAIFVVKRTMGSVYGDSLEIAIAVIGAALVIYQLSKDHQITKAEFIYNLNQSFSENKHIEDIYDKLKKDRDETYKFTKEDGRKMGDYVMFFQIMEYLVANGLISMDMVDHIFANKFFIFMHHQKTWEYQTQYDGINQPLINLYVRWYNFRVHKNLNILYDDYVIAENMSYFIPCTDKKGRKTITYDTTKIPLCPKKQHSGEQS
jgi:hypothetical protein